MQHLLNTENTFAAPVGRTSIKGRRWLVGGFCYGLLICGMLAGCSGLANPVSSETAIASESTANSNAENGSSPSSSMPEKMSYEEYFSVERELPNELGGAVVHSFRFVAKDKNESYFLTDAERELIYRDCEMIDRFSVYHEVVFFQKGKDIYRLYRPTLTLDKLCTVEKPIEQIFPLSNIALAYLVSTPEGDAYRAEHNGSAMDAPDNIELYHTWIYNSQTGELTDDLTPHLSVDSNGREWFDYHISAK